MSLTGLFKKKKPVDPVKEPKKSFTTSPLTESIITPKRSRFNGRCLAFSIDQSSIQMAAVRHLFNYRKIIDIRKVYIPTIDTDENTKREFINQEILSFLDEHATRKSRVIISLSGNETSFRTFLIPQMKKSELDSAIKFEVKQQIPFPVEDCIYDYQPIYKIADDKRIKLKIALHAATKKYINANLSYFKDHEINVSSIVHSHSTVGQLLRYLPNFNDNISYTLLNIGRDSSEISFYRGASLEFFHVSNNGTSMLGQTSSSTQMEYLAETLASEINTSLDFYSGQYHSQSHSKIFVHGDLCYCDEIIELLISKVGTEFERFPIEKLSFLKNQESSDLDIASVCLPALAAASCDVKMINLLPEKIITAQKVNSLDFAGRLALSALVLFLGGAWWYLSGDIRSRDEKTQSLYKQVEDFRSSDAYHTYNLLKSKIATTQAYLNQAKQNPSFLSLNLKELSLITREEIYLTRLIYENKVAGENITINGKAASPAVPPEILLAEYVENLNASPFYKDVTLVRHTKHELKEGFEIEFTLTMRGII